MAYFTANIDETGLHIPEYIDIRDELIEQFRNIFGQDIYLENDSQEYQMISILAKSSYDALLAVQDAYYARSPRYASGTALDGVVGINGIKRKQASCTQAELRLMGVPGTVILNASAGDDKGNVYLLPDRVELNEQGEALVMSKALIPGPLTASANTITTINSPTRGWTYVTNPNSAIPGQALETDALLRARQAISTANPSRSILQGTIGAIAAVKGVGRYKVYDNDTSVRDENGIPSHSISPVVEGGDSAEIAKVIYLHKGTGGGTYGDVHELVPSSITGEQDTTIQFWRVAYVDIRIELTIKRLAGYTSLTEESVQDALVNFVNRFPIGEDLPISWLWAASICKTTGADAFPTFSVTDIQAGPIDGQMTRDSIEVPYNQVVRCSIDAIKVIQ